MSIILWDNYQKQPSLGVLIKRCSGNMQQIYRRTPMTKCDFNKGASVGCSVNLLHVFRTPFYKYIYWRLLLEELFCLRWNWEKKYTGIKLSINLEITKTNRRSLKRFSYFSLKTIELEIKTTSERDIDDFGFSDAIDEISVRGCKLDFGLA